MKKFKIVSLITSLLISPIAFAESPSYSFIDINYSNLEQEDFSAKGVRFEGSFEINDNFFVFGEYAPLAADIDGFDVNLDMDISGVGIGFTSEVGQNTSWFISYEMGSWSVNGQSEFVEGTDADTKNIRLGIRSLINENVELNANLVRMTIDPETGGADTENGYQIGVAYEMADEIHFVADYESVDQLKIYNVGVRWSF